MERIPLCGIGKGHGVESREDDVFWWKIGQDCPWSWSCGPALLPHDLNSCWAGLDSGRQAGREPPWTRFLASKPTRKLTLSFSQLCSSETAAEVEVEPSCKLSNDKVDSTKKMMGRRGGLQ